MKSSRKPVRSSIAFPERPASPGIMGVATNGQVISGLRATAQTPRYDVIELEVGGAVSMNSCFRNEGAARSVLAPNLSFHGGRNIPRVFRPRGVNLPHRTRRGVTLLEKQLERLLNDVFDTPLRKLPPKPILKSFEHRNHLLIPRKLELRTGRSEGLECLTFTFPGAHLSSLRAGSRAV